MRVHLHTDGCMYRYGIICLHADGIRSLVGGRLQDWTFTESFIMFLSHSSSLPYPINTQPNCNNLTSHILPIITDCIICKPHFVLPHITVTWLASLLHVWEVSRDLPIWHLSWFLQPLQANSRSVVNSGHDHFHIFYSSLFMNYPINWCHKCIYLFDVCLSVHHCISVENKTN